VLRFRQRPVAAADVLVHHGDTEVTGDFTETSGFSVHLCVLRVSVVNEVLECFLELGFSQLVGLPWVDFL